MALGRAGHARDTATRVAVSKMLTALIRQPAHVFVVSHSGSSAFPLAKLLETKAPESQVGIIGFPEKLAESLARLKPSGLQVIDIEKGVNQLLRVWEGGLVRGVVRDEAR